MEVLRLKGNESLLIIPKLNPKALLELVKYRLSYRVILQQ